ncbi:MAG: hypothetical protein ONB44_06545 [candidate division KSB1 bacterium]|nr:hypothetical protein [candidate division KSB1 bacterium]MDZ7301782.1 hypothetical protein [candidate division KSB1 bacterium]MDZ7311439.1 hypothetical protein [candidate division KSB1 bacterium]
MRWSFCEKYGDIFLEADVSQSVDEMIANEKTPSQIDNLPVFGLETEIVWLGYFR